MCCALVSVFGNKCTQKEPQKEVKQVVMPKCVKRLNHETIITAKGLQCQGFTYCSAETYEIFHVELTQIFLSLIAGIAGF